MVAPHAAQVMSPPSSEVAGRPARWTRGFPRMARSSSCSGRVMIAGQALPPNPLALVLRLVSGDSADDPGRHAPGGSREVELARGDGRDLRAGLLDDVDERLELDG